MNLQNKAETSGPHGQVNQPQPIVIQQVARSTWRSWLTRLLFLGLIVSILLNFGMLVQYQEYFSSVEEPMERYHSGEKGVGADKIVLLQVDGTIMPPFTKRILRSIDQAKDDDRVKGVVLAVDSPGGLVADSHQIYHRLAELRKEKPIFVAMKRMAASGGYYIAMGAGPEGKIYAEPTTWTGSIGVIIPRYDATVLARKAGVTSDPLKTGKFKDSLSPFRELDDDEQVVWKDILNDSFQRFLRVVAENRAGLNFKDVRQLATGQVFTADQAKQNGLIDEIGYEDNVIDALKMRLGLDKVRVVTYQFRPGLLELLTGTMQAGQSENVWRSLMEATVPRAMYYCSWGLGLPYGQY